VRSSNSAKAPVIRLNLPLLRDRRLPATRACIGGQGIARKEASQPAAVLGP